MSEDGGRPNRLQCPVATPRAEQDPIWAFYAGLTGGRHAQVMAHRMWREVFCRACRITDSMRAYCSLAALACLSRAHRRGGGGRKSK